MTPRRILVVIFIFIAVLVFLLFMLTKFSSITPSLIPHADLLLLGAIIPGILGVLASLKDIVELAEKLHGWRPGEQTSKMVQEYVQGRAHTVALRNRSIMLNKVRVFWIEGVLENSLHGALLLQLGMVYRHDMVNHPWDMVLQRPQKATQSLPEGTSIVDVYDELGGALLILGDPGSGKTTTLLELTRALLARAVEDDEYPIPAVFNLSSWSENRKRIEEWLVDELNSKYDVPTYVGQGWVKANEMLVLLDGLDEVRNEFRDECVRAINLFLHEHMISAVVCSRTYDYEMLTARLSLPGAIVQAPLSLKQIDSYLASLGNPLSGVRTVVKNDPVLQELAQSPLVLSIIALVYRGMSVYDIEPSTREETLRHLFDTYISRMYQHRKPSDRWGADRITQGMIWLGRLMKRNAQTIFHIEQLHPEALSKPAARKLYTLGVIIVLMLLVGASLGLSTGLALKIISQSVFKSTIGGVLYGLMGCLGISIAVTASYQLKYRMALGLLFGAAVATTVWTAIDNLLVGIVVGSVVGVSTIFAYRKIGLTPRTTNLSEALSRINTARKKLGWSWKTGSLGFIKRLPLGLVFGLAGGLVTGSVYSWGFGLATAVLFSLTFGFAGALSYGMIDINIGLVAKPNEGIRRSTENAIRFGLAGGLWLGAVTGFLGTLLSDISTGTILGLSFLATGFAIGGIIAGGLSAIQHYILRILLFIYESVPLKYAKFLNQGIHHIFLRPVGGGYIFMHRLLLEHFADKSGAHPMTLSS